jgi:hypothetical protein
VATVSKKPINVPEISAKLLILPLLERNTLKESNLRSIKNTGIRKINIEMYMYLKINLLKKFFNFFIFCRHYLKP